jgi:tetratricopeptide (TPR) repeat protein
LRRAATVDPDNVVCRFELATLYQKTQRLLDALRIHEQVTEIEPENGVNYFLMGNLNSRLNRFDASEKAYKKVIEVAPDRPEGYRGLAELYLKFDRNRPQTVTLASKAVELVPTAMNYFVLAGACDRNGDRAGSLSAAKRAAELEPNNVRYQRMYQAIRGRK